MVRVVQSVVVVAFFLVMAASLLRNHVIPGWDREGIVVDHDVLTDSWANQDEWMVLRFGGQELGALRTVAEKDELEDFYIAAGHFQLTNPFIKGRIVSAARLNRNLELEQFRIRIHIPALGASPMDAETLWGDELPAGVFEVKGLVEGRNLTLALRRDDARQFKTIRLAQAVTLSDSLTPIMRGQMLTKGVPYSVDIYDPLWGGNAGTVKIEYLDDVVPADDPRVGDRTPLKKVELRMATARTYLYVDQNGTVVRREIPLLPDSPGSPGSSLNMDRVEPTVGREEFPGLIFMPETVSVARGEVTGTDSGEVLRGISAFSFISKALEGSLMGGGNRN